MCSAATPSEVVPNAAHAYNPVTISGITDPDDDVLAIAVTGVRMDEADQFGVSYPFPAQILGNGTGQIASGGELSGLVQVRAERDGLRQAPGNGRVYHLLFTATDPHGASCQGDVRVGVRFNVTQAPVDNYPAVNKDATLQNPQ